MLQIQPSNTAMHVCMYKDVMNDTRMSVCIMQIRQKKGFMKTLTGWGNITEVANESKLNAFPPHIFKLSWHTYLSLELFFYFFLEKQVSPNFNRLLKFGIIGLVMNLKTESKSPIFQIVKYPSMCGIPHVLGDLKKSQTHFWLSTNQIK